MQHEEWRPVEEYPDYEVSNMGNIRRVTTQRALSIFPSNGYRQVAFRVKGKQLKKSVHRLVAQAFIPNIDNKPTVNHINGRKDDNRVENLEWATYSENHLHAFRVLKRPTGNREWSEERRKSASERMKGKVIPNLLKSVAQYGKTGEFIQRFQSLRDAMRATGISETSIANCLSNRTKTAGGYKWTY